MLGLQRDNQAGNTFHSSFDREATRWTSKTAPAGTYSPGVN